MIFQTLPLEIIHKIMDQAMDQASPTQIMSHTYLCRILYDWVISSDIWKKRLEHDFGELDMIASPYQTYKHYHKYFSFYYSVEKGEYDREGIKQYPTKQMAIKYIQKCILSKLASIEYTILDPKIIDYVDIHGPNYKIPSKYYYIQPFKIYHAAHHTIKKYPLLNPLSIDRYICVGLGSYYLYAIRQKMYHIEKSKKLKLAKPLPQVKHYQDLETKLADDIISFCMSKFDVIFKLLAVESQDITTFTFIKWSFTIKKHKISL